MNTDGMSRHQPRVLVVDDERSVLTVLKQVLQGEGYEIISSQDGINALNALREQHPELIILDINLPTLNGFEVCRQARSFSQIPIIAISGRASDDDKMLAFELGVDDYITKPFSLRELAARVRAVLRRSAYANGDHGQGVFQCEGLEIEFDARRIRCFGAEVNTTPFEFDLLKALVLNPGKVMTHKVLLKQVWGPEYGEEREYLRVHLSHLRRKIERDPTHPRYIQTVPRVGYRFVPPKEA